MQVLHNMQTQTLQCKSFYYIHVLLLYSYSKSIQSEHCIYCIQCFDWLLFKYNNTVLIGCFSSTSTKLKMKRFMTIRADVRTLQNNFYSRIIFSQINIPCIGGLLAEMDHCFAFLTHVIICSVRYIVNFSYKRMSKGHM